MEYAQAMAVDDGEGSGSRKNAQVDVDAYCKALMEVRVEREAAVTVGRCLLLTVTCELSPNCYLPAVT